MPIVFLKRTMSHDFLKKSVFFFGLIMAAFSVNSGNSTASLVKVPLFDINQYPVFKKIFFLIDPYYKAFYVCNFHDNRVSCSTESVESIYKVPSSVNTSNLVTHKSHKMPGINIFVHEWFVNAPRGNVTVLNILCNSNDLATAFCGAGFMISKVALMDGYLFFEDFPSTAILREFKKNLLIENYSVFQDLKSIVYYNGLEMPETHGETILSYYIGGERYIDQLNVLPVLWKTSPKIAGLNNYETPLVFLGVPISNFYFLDEHVFLKVNYPTKYFVSMGSCTKMSLDHPFCIPEFGSCTNYEDMVYACNRRSSYVFPNYNDLKIKNKKKTFESVPRAYRIPKFELIIDDDDVSEVVEYSVLFLGLDHGNLLILRFIDCSIEIYNRKGTKTFSPDIRWQMATENVYIGHYDTFTSVTSLNNPDENPFIASCSLHNQYTDYPYRYFSSINAFAQNIVPFEIPCLGNLTYKEFSLKQQFEIEYQGRQQNAMINVVDYDITVMFDDVLMRYRSIPLNLSLDYSRPSRRSFLYKVLDTITIRTFYIFQKRFNNYFIECK